MSDSSNAAPQEPEAPASAPEGSPVTAAVEGSPPPTSSEAAPTGVQGLSNTLQLTADLEQSYAGFDPSVHAVDAAGRPVLKKGGGFARKRGRKPGEEKVAANSPYVSAPASAPASATGEIAPAATATAKMDSAMSARFLAANVEMLGIALFGDEWEVTDEKEMKQMVGGFKSYIDSVGGVEVSPNVGLMFTLGGYALPRLKKPETKSRIKKAAEWIAAKFQRK